MQNQNLLRREKDKESCLKTSKSLANPKFETLKNQRMKEKKKQISEWVKENVKKIFFENVKKISEKKKIHKSFEDLYWQQWKKKWFFMGSTVRKWVGEVLLI